MRKLWGAGAALALVLTGTAGLASPADAVAGTQATTARTVSWTLKDPFSREIVRPGDRDVDPYHIEHVYEVQIRLKRLGLLKATPNGTFGPQTTAAVKVFQKRNGLRQTGVVNYKTWQPLIKQSTKGRAAVPDACLTAGWHACYDRSRHQLSLYRNGNLLNSWLVRGGGYTTQTRVGNFSVFSRDIDHRSGLFDGAPMPYSQFFSRGQALHGSRFMVDPYEGHSHGCVNMWVKDAKQLWNLTSTRNLRVHVYGAWD